MRRLRTFNTTVQMTCAECGHPLSALERGKECVGCKMWPLCDGCEDTHKGRHAPELTARAVERARGRR